MTTCMWRATRTVEAYTVLSLVQSSQEQSPRTTASDLHIHVVSVLCIGLASWRHTWPLDKGPNGHVVGSVGRPSFGTRLNVGVLMCWSCAERIGVPFVISPAESQRAQDVLNRYMPRVSPSSQPHRHISGSMLPKSCGDRSKFKYKWLSALPAIGGPSVIGLYCRRTSLSEQYPVQFRTIQIIRRKSALFPTEQ